MILERLGITTPQPLPVAAVRADDWLAIARSAQEQWRRVNAVSRLDSQADLQGIAEQEGDGEVRRAAVRKLLDQDLLFRFARTDPYARVRMVAASRLTRPQDIESIGASEKNPDVLLALSNKGSADQ